MLWAYTCLCGGSAKLGKAASSVRGSCLHGFFPLALFLLEFDSHAVHVSELENGVWSLGPKLCSIMVKQEQNLPLDLPESQLPASSIPVLNLNPLQRLPLPEEVSPSKICWEPRLSHSSTPGDADPAM